MKNTESQSIAQRLNYLVRTIFKTTPEEFAEQVGVNGMTIRNIISGKAQPSFNTISNIVEYSTKRFPNFNPNWFTLGQGQPLAGEEAKQSNFMTHVHNHESRRRIWEAVEKRLIELKMLKGEFAAAVDYTPARVSNILNDRLKTIPRASFFHKMLEVLGLSEEELLLRAGLQPENVSIAETAEKEDRTEAQPVKMFPSRRESIPSSIAEELEYLRSQLAKKDIMIDSLLQTIKSMGLN